jgi:hypothetical protein
MTPRRLTAEDAKWLEEALADPVLRFLLEQLAPYSEDVRTALGVAAAFDRARRARAQAHPNCSWALMRADTALSHRGP